jgi:hypothetical protein
MAAQSWPCKVGHLFEEVAALQHRCNAVACVLVAFPAIPPVAQEPGAAALQLLCLLRFKITHEIRCAGATPQSLATSLRVSKNACGCTRASRTCTIRCLPAGPGPEWRQQTAQMPWHRRCAVQLRSAPGVSVVSGHHNAYATCNVARLSCELSCMHGAVRSWTDRHLAICPAASHRS